MRNFKNTLALILTSISTTATFAAGLSDLATEGQRVSYLILEAVTPDKLDLSQLPEAEFRDRVRTFYNEHHKDLLDEAAKTSIELRAVNTNKACGETGHERYSKVYLSRSECVDKIDSTAAMARLLIGEYVHHLQNGDEFTDWVKLVVVSSYAALNADDYKELSQRTNPYAVDKKTNFKDIAGRIYFNSDPQRAQIFGILHDGRVILPVEKKLNESTEVIPICERPVQWDATKQAFVTWGEWNITGYDNRYWGQGLYERYPIWIKKSFAVEIRFVQNGEGALVTFDMPVRMDFSTNSVVLKKVTMSMVSRGEKAVVDAFMNSHRVK